MKLNSKAIFLLLLSMQFFACQTDEREVKLLLVSSNQIQAGPYTDEVNKFADSKNYLLTSTNNLNYLNADSLKQFSAVFFNQLTLDQLNPLQMNALERFIEAGGIGLGIGLTASAQHRFTSDLLYTFFDSNSNQRASVSSDKFTIHSFGKGKLIAIRKASSQVAPAQLTAEGISMISGDIKPLHFNQLNTSLFPPDHWFEVDTLTMSLNEPMEMEVLQNGDVLFIERSGSIQMVHAKDKTVKFLGKVPAVFSESNGLNGLALDPDFAINGFIYLSYLSEADTSHQRISRFTIHKDALDFSTEKIIFEIPIDKANGWHGTNALEFDSKGNLYISMGDFTLQANHIAGYAQIDERRGKWRHDAQRTSGNTNSLIGKILRIHPEQDGTYTIPEGNLFPEASDKTKAEIFVMGCRNPYRFSLDSHTDVLYFGEVGPDAWENGVKGPRGYDELNVVKKAGFYGWPYFVADNKSYYDFDYNKDSLGPLFNPLQVINDSPNNTGLRELPPAQKPIMWYPKGKSKLFPYLGSGGMNIMIGPKYYRNDFSDSSGKFPEHYDGKLFIYDWVRNWIIAVELDDHGALKTMEPFLATKEFVKIIDMKFGPDGTLYLLEYGSKGFQANEDASIKRIHYTPGKAKSSFVDTMLLQARSSWQDLLPAKEGLDAGRQLILSQSCLTCHHPIDKIIGPSFFQIAERFFEDDQAYAYLPKKIIGGGTGNWQGNIIMPANAYLSEQQAIDITSYILSFREVTY